MVDKMMKYSFILLTSEKEGFLEKIQELGVVDITRSEKPVDHDSSIMLEGASRAKKVLDILEGINYSEDADAEAIAAVTIEIREDILGYVETTVEKLKNLKAAHETSQKQMAAVLPWGKYDKKALDSIAELGYTIRYYCMPSKSFDPAWAELYPLQVVEEDGKNTWFVTIAPKDEAYTFPANEIAAPSCTHAEAAEEAKQIKQAIIECKAGLLNAKDYIPAIKEAYNSNLVTLDRYLADAAGEGAAEDHITLFTGFAPVEEDARISCDLF